MTKARRFLFMMCGIGAVQLVLIVLKATGIIPLDWQYILAPIEMVVIICAFMFLYIVVYIVEDMKEEIKKHDTFNDIKESGGGKE